MPYNALGDLYKIEVVKRLQKMGCNVKSVHALNLILEKMGILIHSGDHWLTSKNGVKYTIYSKYSMLMRGTLQLLMLFLNIYKIAEEPKILNTHKALATAGAFFMPFCRR